MTSASESMLHNEHEPYANGSSNNAATTAIAGVQSVEDFNKMNPTKDLCDKSSSVVVHGTSSQLKQASKVNTGMMFSST